MAPTGVRRTEDFHTVKTRGLTVQAFDGTFAPTGSVLAAYDERGHYAPSLDLSLNTVSAGSGTFETVSLIGPTETGNLTWTTGLTINGTPLPNFDPSGNLFELLDPSSNNLLIPLVEGYNRLLSILALQNAFVTIRPPPPALIFQTPAAIQLGTFLTVDGPSGAIVITLFVPASVPTSLALGPRVLTGSSALSIVTELNNLCYAASMPLNFFLTSAGSVNISIASGYSFYFTDSVHYGEGARLMTHLGLGALLPYYTVEDTPATGQTPTTYDAYQTGVPITAGPSVPTAPADPIPSSITSTSFTISFTPTADTWIGIYLDISGGGLQSWDLIPAFNSSYIFTDLTPETPYSAAITYLSDYDESPLSPTVSVTTLSSAARTYNVLTSPSTQIIDASGEGSLNGVFWKVTDVSSSVWSYIADLQYVDHIESITLNYYSGFNEGTYLNSDATFLMDRDVAPPSGSHTLFRAAQRRVSPTRGSDYFALGSRAPRSVGPITYPSGPVTITNQPLLRLLFGSNTNVVNRTLGMQFYWHCATAGTAISNSQLNEFRIRYSPVDLVYQTSSKIRFVAIVGSTPITVNYSLAVGTVPCLTIVKALNTRFVTAGVPLAFTLNSDNTVTLSDLSGGSTSYYYTDQTSYGEGQQFMNYLGLNALLPNYPGKLPSHIYTGDQTGVAIVSGRGSEFAIPAAPAVPAATGVFNTQIEISFSAATAPVQFIGIYLNGVSYNITAATDTVFLITGLTRSTTYSIRLTYLTDYDEGPKSPTLTVTTTNVTFNVADVWASSYTTVTPSDPGISVPNNTIVVVSSTGPAIWSNDLVALTHVNQINHIELLYYSGLNAFGFLPYNEANDANTLLYFARGSGPYTVEQPIFYAGQHRVIQQPSDASWSAVGSSVNQGFPGPSVDPNTVTTLTYLGNEALFRTLFGNGTNTIDTTTPIQFYWVCRWNGTYIINSQLNEFKIYYT